jgi:hypothetical protein
MRLGVRFGSAGLTAQPANLGNDIPSLCGIVEPIDVEARNHMQRCRLSLVPRPAQQLKLGSMYRAHGAERHLRGHRSQPPLGQFRPSSHPKNVTDLMTGCDGVAVEDTRHERIQLALQDSHHRLVQQR